MVIKSKMKHFVYSLTPKWTVRWIYYIHFYFIVNIYVPFKKTTTKQNKETKGKQIPKYPAYLHIFWWIKWSKNILLKLYIL